MLTQQYIPWNIHVVWLWFVLLWLYHQFLCRSMWFIRLYSSGLLPRHWGNRMIAPMPVKKPWRIYGLWRSENKNKTKQKATNKSQQNITKHKLYIIHGMYCTSYTCLYSDPLSFLICIVWFVHLLFFCFVLFSFGLCIQCLWYSKGWALRTADGITGGHFKNAYKLSNLRALKILMLCKIFSFDVWPRYFVWNFKATLWNSTKNMLPKHWKMSDFKSS